MAIQFECSSCRKAIEVDDDLANRLVACPYCRSTVRAPLTSSLAETQPIARKSPAALSPHADPDAPPPPAFDLPVPPPFPALRGNLAGNLGLTAGLLAWGALLVISLQIVGLAEPHLPADMETRQPTQQELAVALNKVVSDPANRHRIVLFGTAIMALTVVSLFLSVWGIIRRGARKGTSIAGLIISGFLMFCFLASLFLNVNLPAPG